MAPLGAVSASFQIGTGQKGKGVEGGRRLLRQPRGISLAADGSLLVADYGNHCVLRFKAGDCKGKVVAGEEGKALPNVDPMKDLDKPGPMTLPKEEGVLLKQPGDVCEDGEGGILVLDTEDGSVQRFRGREPARTFVPHEGKSVHKSLGTPDSIKNPRSVLIAEDGSLIVCDSWSHRVLRFAPPNSPEASAKPKVLAGTPNSYGRRADQLAFPSAAVLGPDGALYVSDTNNHRVQRFMPDEAEGVCVAGSAAGKSGAGLGDLNMPTGICMDPEDGSLYIADRCNSRVLRFPAGSQAGSEGELVAGPEMVQRPWGICLGKDGAVYVSDERAATVLRLQAGGGQPQSQEEQEPEPPAPAPKAAPEPPTESPPELPATAEVPAACEEEDAARATYEVASVSGNCMDLD